MFPGDGGSLVSTFARSSISGLTSTTAVVPQIAGGVPQEEARARLILRRTIARSPRIMTRASCSSARPGS